MRAEREREREREIAAAQMQQKAEAERAAREAMEVVHVCFHGRCSWSTTAVQCVCVCALEGLTHAFLSPASVTAG